MFRKTKSIRYSVILLATVVIIGGTAVGCHSHKIKRASRAVSNVRTLGSVIDEANQLQEEFAELAKFTIYMHEFEINAPRIEDGLGDPDAGLANQATRGYQLTPSGQDHVREIARQMLQCVDNATGQAPDFRVVVERSNTSKSANTVYQYPVHYNEQLDAVRRQMVVSVLQQLGVSWADQCVVVAPAFSTGMSATEAAAAYRKAMGGGGQSSGSGSSFGNIGGSSYEQ